MQFQPTSKQSCKDCDIMVEPYETRKLEPLPPSKDGEGYLGSGGHLREYCSRCKSGKPCGGV